MILQVPCQSFLKRDLFTQRNPRSKNICVDEEGGYLNAGHRMTSPTVGLAKVAGWASATGEKWESALPLLTPEDVRVLSSKRPR
jgi:hypothetical protein